MVGGILLIYYSLTSVCRDEVIFSKELTTVATVKELLSLFAYGNMKIRENIHPSPVMINATKPRLSRTMEPEMRYADKEKIATSPIRV